MDKKKIIVLAVALIAVVIIIAGAAAAILGGNDNYAAKLEQGYRYLQEGDYNAAILLFQEVIQNDQTNENAYYGLYQAYLYSGQNSNALSTLRTAVSLTNSSKLQALLNQMEQQNAAAQVQEPVTQVQTVQNQPAEDDKLLNPTLNTELLTLFNSANYGDYCSKYGSSVGTLVNGCYSKYLESLGATLVYYDTSSERVIDTTRGVPYNIYMPSEIRLDNITILFGGVSQISYDTLKNLSGVSNASRSGNAITFVYESCEVTIYCDDSGIITSASENSIVPTSENVAAEEYTMVTQILDATTGQPVSGAKIQAYVGYSTYGESVEGTSDSAGYVNLDLSESGTYTVSVSKDGYISETFEVYVLSGMSQTYETFYISPVMGENSIRFVLSWGASPSDLDSYLIGTAGDGSSTYVNYQNKTDTNNQGQMVAELDVDDTDGYGPETITLYDTTGSYEFSVVDFTQSGTMSMSGATVKIYVGSTLYTTVSVPAGLNNGWSVCRIVNGEITVTNTAG